MKIKKIKISKLLYGCISYFIKSDHQKFLEIEHEIDDYFKTHLKEDDGSVIASAFFDKSYEMDKSSVNTLYKDYEKYILETRGVRREIMTEFKKVTPLLAGALLGIITFSYSLPVKIPMFIIIGIFLLAVSCSFLINHSISRKLSIQREKAYRVRCYLINIEKLYPHYVAKK